MPDLAHAIMEQAAKFGRTVTFQRANALVETISQAASPVFIEMILSGEGKKSESVSFPTHARGGRLLSDEDFIGLLKQSAEQLDKREQS